MIFNEGTVLLYCYLAMHFSWLFWVNYIVRHIMEVRKNGTPFFHVDPYY